MRLQKKKFLLYLILGIYELLFLKGSTIEYYATVLPTFLWSTNVQSLTLHSLITL